MQQYAGNCEISPTRCNNCVLFFAMALLYMFRATISPIIRSTYAVYFCYAAYVLLMMREIVARNM